MPNNAQIQSMTVPHIVQPGQFNASAHILNTGDTTWDSGYRLGSTNPENNTYWGVNRVVVHKTVHPGESIILDFSPTAPNDPGSHSFDWRMLQEGVVWFGDIHRQNIKISMPAILPPWPTDGNNLISCQIFDTGPFAADGKTYSIEWNPGRDIKVVASKIWTGVTMGGILDIACVLSRKSDGSILQSYGWDHYTDPTAPNHGQYINFSPYYFTIGQNDALRLSYGSTAFNPPKNAHHLCIIWAIK